MSLNTPRNRITHTARTPHPSPAKHPPALPRPLPPPVAPPPHPHARRVLLQSPRHPVGRLDARRFDDAVCGAGVLEQKHRLQLLEDAARGGDAPLEWARRLPGGDTQSCRPWRADACSGPADDAATKTTAGGAAAGERHGHGARWRRTDGGQSRRQPQRQRHPLAKWAGGRTAAGHGGICEGGMAGEE